MARAAANERTREEVELIDRLVAVNRVAKVVKGGRRFGFAALVVVGDGKGRVGFGTGKAKEVPDAVRKAADDAKRSMIRVPLREGRTLHHDVTGRYGAGRVVVRSAPAGTGIIAGGPMRAVFEALGVQDVVAKSTGTSNPHNMVKATIDALLAIRSPRAIAGKRSKKIGEIISRREQVLGVGNVVEGAGEEAPQKARAKAKAQKVETVTKARKKMANADDADKGKKPPAKKADAEAKDADKK